MSSGNFLCYQFIFNEPVEQPKDTALGGSTAPIVLALFEGSYPTVAHSGTVRYFDGTDGNDAWDGTAGTYQGASVGPKKTWTTGYTSGDSHMYCKRGTVIDVTDTALIHLGTDWLVEDYGDASLAKPVLQLSATKTNNFVFNGTSGIIEFRNIRIVSLLATPKSGGAFSAGRGARVIVKDCEANNFTAGATVGGAYSVVDNLTTTQCTLGVSTGSTAAPAANYSLTMNSNLTADSDVYSAHDRTGTPMCERYNKVHVAKHLSFRSNVKAHVSLVRARRKGKNPWVCSRRRGRRWWV